MVLDHREQVTRLGITFWTEHAHEALARLVEDLGELLESDRRVSVVTQQCAENSLSFLHGRLHTRYPAQRIPAAVVRDVNGFRWVMSAFLLCMESVFVLTFIGSMTDGRCSCVRTDKGVARRT